MLRRFVPLLVLLGVSLIFLLARLWDIQIVQHEVWSTEAVNLVRSYAGRSAIATAASSRATRRSTPWSSSGGTSDAVTRWARSP